MSSGQIQAAIRNPRETETGREKTRREQTSRDQIPPKADAMQGEPQFRQDHEEKTETGRLRQWMESGEWDTIRNNAIFDHFGLRPAA